MKEKTSDLAGGQEQKVLQTISLIYGVGLGENCNLLV